MLVDHVAETSALNTAQYLAAEAPSAPTQAPRRGEALSFAMPRGIWPVMFASYATFFAAMAVAASGDGMTLMMLVISAGYTLIYFGTAALLNHVDTADRPRRMEQDFDTCTGRLSYLAGLTQILAVPILVAFFGVGIAVLWALVN